MVYCNYAINITYSALICYRTLQLQTGERLKAINISMHQFSFSTITGKTNYNFSQRHPLFMTHPHTYVHSHTQTPTLTCIDTCAHMRVHTHTYTHTHACAHMHKHRVLYSDVTKSLQNMCPPTPSTTHASIPAQTYAHMCTQPKKHHLLTLTPPPYIST